MNFGPLVFLSLDFVFFFLSKRENRLFGSYLVGLNGGNFLVALDEVTDLCRTVSKLQEPDRKKISDIRFENCFRVPSVMDSAMLGTLTIESAENP